MLELSLTARAKNQSLSEFLSVENEILAADLDRCFAYQLSKFDAKQKREDWRGINQAVMAAQVYEPLTFDDEQDDEFAVI